MSWREALDAALGEHEGTTVVVEGPGGRATLDATERGPVGVRVGQIRVERARAKPAVEQGQTLRDGARLGGEDFLLQAADARLDGAILRTPKARGGEFTEIRVEGPERVVVQPYRVNEAGDRVEETTDVPRRELARFLDALSR